MDLPISIDSSLTEIIKLGIIQFDRVRVLKKIDALAAEIEALCVEVRRKYGSPGDAMDQLNVTRSLYWKIGLDPTRHRPSSEALLRRVLKGSSLYQINTIVDICNLCSLKLLLSLGLYDIEQIQGPVQLRSGREGEGYDGIGKDYIHVANKIILSDNLGPFGNPSADSARTMITLATTKVLFVVFVPTNYKLAMLNEHLDFIEAKVKKYHICQTVARYVI